eukprot:2251913-Amphidinium_carterae.1
MARNASRSPSSATGGLTHSPISMLAQSGSAHPRLITYRTCRSSCNHDTSSPIWLASSTHVESFR